MTRPTASHLTYRFGVFYVHVERGELFRKQIRIRLQEQPFRLLCLLLENAGEVVTKEGMRERLWPQNTFVEFDASLTVAIGKLRTALEDTADNPRFIETIPRKGYRFLAPVERIQEEVPLVAPEKAAELTAPDENEQTPSQRSVRSISLYIYVLAATAAVLLAASVFFLSFRGHLGTKAVTKTSASAPPTRYIRRSVAVLGFRNLHGRPNDDWLSQAFSEMLGTELSEGGDLRVIPDEDVARAKRELWTNHDPLATPMLERFHQTLGADMVVSGSYTVMSASDGDRLRLDVRVQNTSDGEIIAESATTRPEKQVFELASDAGDELRKQLNVRLITVSGDATARSSLPSNAEAIRFYAEGRAKLWDFDFIGARDLLTRSIALDPGFPLAHSNLASAWQSLGHSAKAAAEAKRAVELSGHLSKDEQLLVVASYHSIVSDWAAAQSAYAELFKTHPDSLQYGLLLAGAQSHTKPSDALLTIALMRQLPSPVGDDPRIDLREASVLISSDVKAAQTAAKRAVSKANAEGSPLMVARGNGILCGLGIQSGNFTQETVSDCQKAIDGYAEAGDRNNEARAFNDFAGIYFQHGDLLRAESMWRQAQTEFERVGDTQGLAVISNNLGATLLTEGKLAEAKKLLNVAIPGYQAISDEDGVSRALSDLGTLSREQGNLAEAEASYRQAKSVATRIEDQSAEAVADCGLGDIFMDRGDLVSARKSYEASFNARVKLAEAEAAAESRIALGQLSIEEGHPEIAVLVLRESLAQFRQEQQSDDELTAASALIRALVAQGNYADAKSEVDQQQLLATSSQNRISRLIFSISSADVAAISEHPEIAKALLNDILRETHQFGLLRLEFESELALAAVEEKVGSSDAAHSHLAALKAKASSRGFARIQHKADSLQ
jgi:DNA-binding winged helix-turn-helix (wHTH) protein/tetratricopeptide (TPR) repeat protein